MREDVAPVERLRAAPETPDLAAALAIADEICAAAIWSGPRCVFHGAIAPESLAAPARFATLGGDLYEGSAGIARFLVLAHRYSRDPLHLGTAEGALRHAFETCEGYGLFTGVLGPALVALEAGLPEFRDKSVALVDAAIEGAIADPDPAADLLSGLAGVIAGLVAALRVVPEQRWLDAALMLARRLVAVGTGQVPGLSWPMHPGAEEHLCGLAHGASGVAHAMTLLAGLDPGEPLWETTARRARDYERRHYVPEFGSWADLRADAAGESGTPSYPHMWCHGSIGIAAERLDASDPLGRADRLAALEAVRSSTQAILSGPRGPGASDALNGSLCHGLSGAADVLLDAAGLAGDPRPWLALARAATAAIRDDARRPEGWRCGVPGGWECPGLMLGWAGIGWTQLRAHAPKEVPSAWRAVAFAPGP